MRISIVKTVIGKEMLELLRNRRSLLVMLGVPLLLYPLLTFTVAAMTQSRRVEMTQREASVVVRGGRNAPMLRNLLGAKDSGIKIVRSPLAEGDRGLKSGAADAIVDIPRDYENDSLLGKDVQLDIRVDRSRSTTPYAEKKIGAVLEKYQQWVVEQRLAWYNLPPSIAAGPKHVITDVASQAQNFGLFLAHTLPVLLLITGMLGALYPALNATTTERELGTLETLLVSPATRGELLLAKGFVVLLCALVTALVNMLSMSLVLLHSMPQIAKVPGGLAIDPVALALSYLAAVPTLIFFSALVLMVGLMARNLREANAYATPVMFLPITSLLIAVAEPAASPALMLTPVANTTVIISEVLTGHYRTMDFVLAFVSSCVCAGLVLSLTARMFTNEQLVNPAWEPLTLRGLGKRRGRRSRRLPAVDEAVALFGVVLLLIFYVGSELASLGLMPLLAVTEIVLIAAPALLMGWIARYRWREVYSLRRPSIRALAGSVLLAAGLIPIVNALSYLQQRYNVLPPNQGDLEGITSLLEGLLRSHPILAPATLGILAGVCEELLFRGPIQCAFARRLPIGMAILFAAILFGVAHMDISGLPLRTGLGVVLGWVVWRSGSIFPAMLLHAAYDGGQLGWAAFQMSHDAAFSPMYMASPFATGSDRLIIAAGCLLVLAGFVLVRRSKIADDPRGVAPAIQPFAIAPRQVGSSV